VLFRLRVWVVVCALIACFGARAEPKTLSELFPKSYALVIGNDAYPGGTGGWPRLSNAIMDADLVAAELKRQGFEVTAKRNLTSDQLERTLRDFFLTEGQTENARLIVWFAGHGHTIDGEGYLVPVDAPGVADEPAFKRKALSIRSFSVWMRQATSRHVLAVFDSCFSGTVFTNLPRRVGPDAAYLQAGAGTGEADDLVGRSPPEGG
jgi:uncharacterized caspase-like protein